MDDPFASLPPRDDERATTDNDGDNGADAGGCFVESDTTSLVVADNGPTDLDPSIGSVATLLRVSKQPGSNYRIVATYPGNPMLQHVVAAQGGRFPEDVAALAVDLDPPNGDLQALDEGCSGQPAWICVSDVLTVWQQIICQQAAIAAHGARLLEPVEFESGGPYEIIVRGLDLVDLPLDPYEDVPDPPVMILPAPQQSVRILQHNDGAPLDPDVSVNGTVLGCEPFADVDQDGFMDYEVTIIGEGLVGSFTLERFAWLAWGEMIALTGDGNSNGFALVDGAFAPACVRIELTERCWEVPSRYTNSEDYLPWFTERWIPYGAAHDGVIQCVAAKACRGNVDGVLRTLWPAGTTWVNHELGSVGSTEIYVQRLSANPPVATVTQELLVHEFGHQFGLLDRAMNAEGQILHPDHESVDGNDGCIMIYAIVGVPSPEHANDMHNGRLDLAHPACDVRIIVGPQSDRRNIHGKRTRKLQEVLASSCWCCCACSGIDPCCRRLAVGGYCGCLAAAVCLRRAGFSSGGCA